MLCNVAHAMRAVVLHARHRVIHHRVTANGFRHGSCFHVHAHHVMHCLMREHGRTCQRYDHCEGSDYEISS